MHLFIVGRNTGAGRVCGVYDKPQDPGNTIWPQATSVCGLKVPVYGALSYQCMGP